jgi:hypothetical protein
MENIDKNINENEPVVEEQATTKTETTVAENQEDAKAIKIMRIAIAVLLVFAMFMALIIFIPVKGELTNSMTSSDLNGDGTAIRVIGEVRNETNKPAFNVEYKIDVYNEAGEVIKTYTKSIFMLLPKTGSRYEAYLYFENAVDTTCDVEVTVNGYVVGG